MIEYPSLPSAGAVLSRVGLAALLVAAAVSPAAAVTITVHNGDGFHEGFNDIKAAAPVGGNPGTTLGAQRLYVYKYAAQVWGERLGGNVPVVVTAAFDSLGGTATSAILGYARPVSLERDYPGAPKSLTWYVAALENQFAGTDRNNITNAACDPGDLVANKCAEIFSRFNSDVDGDAVLGTRGFYYGLDGKSGTNIDFFSVVLHEIGHGLGLIDLIDPVSGKISPNADPSTDNCQNCTDAYTDNLAAAGFTPSPWLSDMTYMQRSQAIVSNGKLVWNAPAVVATTPILSAGTRADGALKMFAPTVYQPGSSVSHVDTTATPNELMEPALNNPAPHDLRITLALLEDLGWEVVPLAGCGDPSDDSSITSSDALLVLKGAVGSYDCPDYACDVNFAGGVTTSDALLVLKKAVGQVVTLTCPLA